MPSIVIEPDVSEVSNIQSAWAIAERVGEPPRGCVHVWSAPLDVGAERRRALECALSREEREHAARFRGEALARRYAVGRGTLRELLGAYLGMPPREIQLSYGKNGKPVLASAATPAIHFNVAHADGLALYAMSADHPVGIDVERVAPFPDLMSVAANYFSVTERDALARLAPADVVGGFFSIWTRKEAYLKADGAGLSMPLDSFDVAVGRREPAALLRAAGDVSAPARWSLTHLEPGDEFIGALAVPAPLLVARCLRWCP